VVMVLVDRFAAISAGFALRVAWCILTSGGTYRE
jgi:hypothetical protein